MTSWKKLNLIAKATWFHWYLTTLEEKKIKMPALSIVYGNTCKMSTVQNRLRRGHVTNWEMIGIQAKYSGSLQTSEHSDNSDLRRQNATERIMKICPTWRLKEESKWKTSSPYLSNVRTNNSEEREELLINVSHI